MPPPRSFLWWKYTSNTSNTIRWRTPGRPTAALTERTIMTTPLRIGFIGANGRWGPRAHVPALTNLKETQIAAVCTAHADTAQAAAEKYGVKRAYGDIKAMGKDPEVDTALVAVRVPAHYT